MRLAYTTPGVLGGEREAFLVEQPRPLLMGAPLNTPTVKLSVLNVGVTLPLYTTGPCSLRPLLTLSPSNTVMLRWGETEAP